MTLHEKRSCCWFMCCRNCSHSFYDTKDNLKCGIGLGKEDGSVRCKEECEGRNNERLCVKVIGGQR